MNKILIDTSKYDLIIKNNINYSINILNNNTILKIEVLDNINANISLYTLNSIQEIIIILNKNSSLKIDNLAVDSSLNLNVNLLDNTNFNYTYSIINKIDSLNNIKIIHNGKNIFSNLSISGINVLNNKLYFDISGIIYKNSIDSNLNQTTRIINLENGNSKVLPNMIIDNKDVICNHSAYIGEFNYEDLLYLKSRGLTDIIARKLLFKSILLGKMQLDYELEKFHEIINNWR